ncbi:MAG TPA: aldehyde dehydrogenase family protein, partial [Geobacteraceae bacterium]|nr:aldehyde dehydrogenase family protein [Geobacteraceae bacterium]
MHRRDTLYINGNWISPQGRGLIEITNPATEEAIGHVPSGTAEDAASAVGAARAAFEGWSGTSGKERAELLTRMHQLLAARSEEIACIISSEVGMPIKLSRRIQAGLPAAVMESYARLVGSYPFEERIGNSLVLKEAAGVAACITPWNYPLHQVVAKVAPALAAGCTVVLKPSEVAPFSAFILAEIA